MPANAFTGHLLRLLADAYDLDNAHLRLRTGSPGRQHRLAALNRAAVVMCLSAWEAYIEELVRESVRALRPPGPALGAWPALNAYVNGQLGRFHTPSADNVRTLFADAVGLADIRPSWHWQGCTAAQALQRLTSALTLRHQITHGVNPRPVIHNYYSSQLPDFFRRLGRCTDAVVRRHLVDVHGIPEPWPP